MFLHLLYIARKRTFKKDQLMIFVNERTPIFQKKPLQTFRKINLSVANNPLRVIVSFSPQSKSKSTILFFSQNCTNIQKILTENSIPQVKFKTFICLKSKFEAKKICIYNFFKKTLQGLKICGERGGCDGLNSLYV